MRAAICLVPKAAWTPAVAADGQVRDHAEVVEITDLPTLTRWPSGIRVIVRREHPHLGAQLSLIEHRDGWRYQAFVTNTALGQVGFLEARHRAHARVEDRIRVAKDTGLSRFPSREYDINQAWLTLVAIAADLTAWLRLLALPPALVSCEPKALQYRFLHIPARLTRAPAGDTSGCPQGGPGSGRRRDLHQRAGHPNAHLSRRPRPLTAHDQDPRRPTPPRHVAIPRTPKPAQPQRGPQRPSPPHLNALVKEGG